MRRLLVLSLIASLFISIDVMAQPAGRNIANPQLQMVSARLSALGITNPVIEGDIGGLFINPATMGAVDSMPLSITQQKVIGFFDYRLFNISIPYELVIPFGDTVFTKRLSIGFSYGSMGLDGIPETLIEETSPVIRPVGSFSTGFDILQAAVGTSFYEVFGFNRLSTGMSFKVIRQTLDDESRYAVGMDAGFMATYHIETSYLNSLHVGASAINFISTSLIWQSTKEEAFLPLQLFVGARANMFDDTLSLFVNNSLENISFGSEYIYQDNFVLRGSTDFKRFALGTGLMFSNVAGIGYQNYSMRLDYTYTQNLFPFDTDPNHTVSISVLGEARPETPKILEPARQLLTQINHIKLVGVGPKDTAIRIYLNKELSRTSQSDRFGNWVFEEFPLVEGKNEIYVTAFSLEKDASLESETLKIRLDTLLPVLDIHVVPDGLFLKIAVNTNEELHFIEGTVDEKRLDFIEKNDKQPWRARIPMINELKNNSQVKSTMNVLQLFAEDTAGNQTDMITIPFFMALEFPQDRFVHFRDDIRIIGKSSPMTKVLLINDDPVYVDPFFNFSYTKRLTPGKNLLKFQIITLNNSKLNYQARVLMLKTFKDLNKRVKGRREIEFMTTLGVLTGETDGNFYPNAPVTRIYMTKVMINAKNIPIPKRVDTDLFFDIGREDPEAPYVQAAIENGIIFAYPDGFFRPEQALTFEEAQLLLSNSGIVNAELGPLVDETEIISRKDLALLLAFSPKYEILVEELIEWSSGYE